LRERSGLDQAQAVRNAQHLTRIDSDVLRVTAAFEQRTHSFIDVQTLDAGADRRDRTGHFEAEMRRCAGRRRIATSPLKKVGTIETGSCDPNQHLACPDRGQRPLREPQRIRSARMRDFDDVHLVWKHFVRLEAGGWSKKNVPCLRGSSYSSA